MEITLFLKSCSQPAESLSDHNKRRGAFFVAIRRKIVS